MLCEPSFYSVEDGRGMVLEGGRSARPQVELRRYGRWEQRARPLTEPGSWSVGGCYEFQIIQHAK